MLPTQIHVFLIPTAACRFLQGIRQLLHDASAVAPQRRHVLPRLGFRTQAQQPEEPPTRQPLLHGDGDGDGDGDGEHGLQNIRIVPGTVRK